MVAQAVKSVHPLVSSEATPKPLTPQEVPDFPKALAPGKFLKTERPPWAKSVPLLHEAIPAGPLMLPGRTCYYFRSITGHPHALCVCRNAPSLNVGSPLPHPGGTVSYGLLPLRDVGLFF